MRTVLLYVGGGLAVAWGLAHMFPLGAMLRGFGDISGDNRLYFIQEWVAEGMAIIFAGTLVVLFTAINGPYGTTAQVVFATAAGFLVAIGVLTLATGARTPSLPFKICPVVMGIAAACILVGAFI